MISRLFKPTRAKILIIGADERAKSIVDVIKNEHSDRMETIGIIKSAEVEKKISESFAKLLNFNLTNNDESKINKRLEEEKNFNYSEVPIFSDGKEIVKILEKTKPDIVIFTHKSNLMQKIPKHIKIYLMTDFYEKLTGKYYIDDENIEDFVWEVRKKYECGIFKKLPDINMNTSSYTNEEKERLAFALYNIKHGNIFRDIIIFIKAVFNQMKF